MPTALLTGLSGQDGSLLAELLLGKGYEVAAVVHGEPRRPLGRAEHLRERVQLFGGDLLDPESLKAAVRATRPREVYHLAAPTFVPASWEQPQLTMRAIVGSAAALLEAARELREDAGEAPRVFVAASGSMFGDAGVCPQEERTPCRPATPYALAKHAAHELVGVLREREGLFACSGILYNHESERRPQRFVTRRITHAAAQIALGLREELTLGDLTAVRDWSYAGDVVRGIWMMLQEPQPQDYVLASGIGRTVAEFARAAFACVGLEAEGYLRVEDSLVRAHERTPNVGDPTKARTRLGWEPEVDFERLVRRMVDADLAALGAASAN